MNPVFHKNKTLLNLIIHLVIFIATAITAVNGILYGAGSSQDGDNMIGIGYFKAFTMDCNVFAGIIAFLIVCFCLRDLLKNENATPRFVVILHFVSTVCLFFTIVTVVVFLAPLDVTEGKSYWGMFSDDLFIFHLVNPLLEIFSFVFLEDRYRFKKKDCIWGIIPLCAYAVVYILMVAVLKRWRDFYGFSFGGQYYLIPVVIFAVLLLLCLLERLLIWLNRRFALKNDKNCGND